MTDQPPAGVRFARRFVAKIPGQPDIHGIQFPDSGHVIADVAYTGLTGFLTVDAIADAYEGAVIHWADEAAYGQPAPAATFSPAEYEDIKTRWSKTYGKPGTAHPVTEVQPGSEEPRP